MNMTRTEFEFAYHFIRTRIDSDIEQTYLEYALGRVPYAFVWQTMRDILVNLDLGKTKDAKRIYKLFNI
jgi:hypothetical protein